MKPRLHFCPPHNWMNDPNGLIYYNGEYHIFYQHFPYAPKWGTMHWGHATTKDFIDFKHHPIALYPSQSFDKNGCFSGSAIEYNGKMYLYYTSIQYAKMNPLDIHVQYSDADLIASQSLLISEDGYTFNNDKDKKMIIDVIRDPQVGDIAHTRDPKVWINENNQIDMIIGTKVPSQKGYDGKVLFYRSDNGIDFNLINSYSDETIGDMWECPDLCKVNNQYYMIFSPENINEPPKPNSSAVIMKVSFDEETCTMIKEKDYQIIDHGTDFYAPQTFVNEDGERIMLGWLRMREPVDQDNWVGMFSLPRVLEEKNDRIYQHPLKHIKELFHKDIKIDFKQPFLLKIELKDNETINLGGLKLSYKNDQLVSNRESVSLIHEKVCQINNTEELGGQCHLDIYYDHHVFEIYINDGFCVLTQIVYSLTNEINIGEYVCKGM